MSAGPDPSAQRVGPVELTVADAGDATAARAAARAAAASCGVGPLDAVVAGLAAGLMAERLAAAGDGALTIEAAARDERCVVTLAPRPPLVPGPELAELHAMLGDLGFVVRPGDGGEGIMQSLPLRVPRGDGEDADSGHDTDETLLLLQQVRWRDEQVRATAAELEDTNRGVLALIQELDEAAAAAVRGAALQERFLSHVTHELRGPLSAIRGLCGLLLDRVDGDLTPEQQRQIELMAQSAADLGLLVDDLLELARSRAGAMPVRVGSFTLTELIGALRAVCRQLDRGPRVELVIEDPPPVAMTSDKGKIGQILRNLVANALKFTERGEVRIVTTVAAGSARFAVHDTGVGIAAEHLPFLFDDFFQVDGPLQRSHRGTGLGLPLSRRLAAQLGGTIEVESEPSEGSTFTAVLPLLYVPPAAEG